MRKLTRKRRRDATVDRAAAGALYALKRFSKLTVACILIAAGCYLLRACI